jgi:uncharacterized protein (DUF1800 family)
MMLFDCELTTGLEAYEPGAEAPWNEQRIRHVYRRLGFGASKEMVENAKSLTPSALIDQIIEDAESAQRPDEPVWSEWAIGNYTDFQTESRLQVIAWALTTMADMINNPLRGRLNLFWHNHFVTRLEAYACPSWLYSYWKVLDDHALGNFKNFTTEIGRTPAMLVFLNGVQNTRFQPNENYARELFELFTLGRDQGYTQQDITNAARALTGYNGFSQLCAPIGFVELLHDPGPKTIFGQTANFNYDSLHDLIFTVRRNEVAIHIATKLYKEFISPEIDADFVGELAELILFHDFQLKDVYRTLFKSERFFDEEIIGTKIKSPLEFYLNFLIENNVALDPQIGTLIIAAASEN